MFCTEEDLLMACRYSYYCLYVSLIEDREYDKREKDFLNYCGMSSPMLEPGSDSPETYSEYQKKLAEIFAKQGVPERD